MIFWSDNKEIILPGQLQAPCGNTAKLLNEDLDNLRDSKNKVL